MRATDCAIDAAAITAALEAAAREAGVLALQKFRSTFETWTKGADSPVSEVDIAVDEMLRARLSKLAPAVGWLSEESVDEPVRLEHSAVWIVDPIDGTRAFIAGKTDWAVSVALVEAGRPRAAALFAPAEDNLFLATAGGGATLNGRRLRAKGESLEGARTAGPKPRLDALAAFGITPLPKVHSLALRIARVAQGTVDVGIAGPNSHDWDLAAADLIVHESGGRLTAFDGAAPTYNRPNPMHGALVAASNARHAMLMQLVQDRRINLQ
ncbi:MAG: 3'(2'),5'-bisphosphate nucleotidase CysQ [Variibacter sp.]